MSISSRNKMMLVPFLGKSLDIWYVMNPDMSESHESFGCRGSLLRLTDHYAVINREEDPRLKEHMAEAHPNDDFYQFEYLFLDSVIVYGVNTPQLITELDPPASGGLPRVE